MVRHLADMKLAKKCHHGVELCRIRSEEIIRRVEKKGNILATRFILELN